MEYIKTEIAAQFQLEGEVAEVSGYGNGHINDTYILKMINGPWKKYILQRINTTIFTKPVEAMQNIEAITMFWSEYIINRGGNPIREGLTLIPAKDGRFYFVDGGNDYWRAYHYIENAASHDRAENSEQIYQCGRAVGKFLTLLDEFPCQTLHITIPDFHDTKKRFGAFTAALEADSFNRAKFAEPEIKAVEKYANQADYLLKLLADNKLPLRVTHNDTKLNNVMLDNKTGEAVCIVDLDTVMPGLSAYDYGDSIRSCANSANEDEQDLSKVYMDDTLFDAFTRGYLQETFMVLTKKEVEVLPMAALLMTYECGMRFLTDYLNGDVYFKTHRPSHNLDRARVQLKMVSEIDYKLLWMETAVRRILNRLDV